MKRALIVVCGFSVMCSASAGAQAKIDFALYEGKPVVRTGEGGTKITKNGIDYWTSGEPPRRYQVIAMVQDKRDEFWDGGHAVGSPSIAAKVKKAGGDAVIIQSENEAGHGGGYSSTTGSASGGLGWLFGFGASGGSKTITRMVVVKYLPDIADPASPPSPSNPTQ
ncbi:hypothetical protein H7F50_19100 [Novosphingobium flavum]|uniref:Uncharacterized protein n=1 Tax=Novosphingobium aerophilum TaxID=2839843 RepID=A0A7X1F7Z2_9SPHN|nr:hypothetical protein [Novosphingobium aerophilum]MBC2652052.1 hypothetical protein [Novosphingobium aerophilum]MBC2663825.1 hypothetical protein [Novosphingobium aerophilum]